MQYCELASIGQLSGDGSGRGAVWLLCSVCGLVAFSVRSLQQTLTTATSTDPNATHGRLWTVQPTCSCSNISAPPHRVVALSSVDVLVVHCHTLSRSPTPSSAPVLAICDGLLVWQQRRSVSLRCNMRSRRRTVGRRRSSCPCRLSPAVVVTVMCLLLVQWLTLPSARCTLHSLVDELPLPATRAALNGWWHNETVAAASLVQRVVLDVAALLIGSALPLSLRPVTSCTPLLNGKGELNCSCGCTLSSSSVSCSLCHRIRLRVRSFSSASLQHKPNPNHSLLHSTLLAFDTALSTLLTASASSLSAPPRALHCPALVDSYECFVRLHDKLFTAPQALHGLFPLLPTTSSTSPTTIAPSAAAQPLFHMSQLTLPSWLSASSGGGGGGGLGYQVRCDASDREGTVLWSMGGGGGGGYRAIAQHRRDRWRVRWRGGSGSGAGLQWDEYSVGGGSGGGLQFEARLSPSSAPHLLSINTSHGAQPDAANRFLPPVASLASLNRSLAARMRHCVRRGHTVHVSGGGGAAGGHRLRVRLRGTGEEGQYGRVELVSRLYHSVTFHFDLVLDRRVLAAVARDSSGERR